MATSREPLKLGQKVWVFNENRRVYPKYGSSLSHAPIWREHWEEKFVIGENKASYLIDREGMKFEPKKPNYTVQRVSKSEWAKGRVRALVASVEELDKRVWVHDWRYEISSLVQRCDDYDVLQQIAKLIDPERTW